MKTRRIVLAGLVLAPLAGLAFASGGSDDGAAIKKNSAAFAAAWNKHDFKALGAMWATDGDLIDPKGVLSTGAGNVEKFLEGEHSGKGFLAHSTFEITKDSVRFITPDVALEDWEVTLTGLAAPDGSTMGPMTHRVTVISKKEGNAWKIAAARPGTPHPIDTKAPETTPKTK